MPSGDFSRPTGPRKPVKRVNHAPQVRKTVAPVTDVQSGRAGHPYSHPAPPPSLGSSIGRQVGGQSRITPPSIRTLTRQDQVRQRHRQTLRAAQASRHDVQAFLGLAPPRTIRSVGFQQSPYMPIGRNPLPNVRDSGVANNPHGPMLNGMVLSPQVVRGAIRTVAAPKGVNDRRLSQAVSILHAAGVSDPFGSTTPIERTAAHRAYRKRLIGFLVRKQQAFQKYTHGDAAGQREIATMLSRLPDRELERLTKWQPSWLDAAQGQVNTAGFSVEGLGQLASAIGSIPRNTIPIVGPALGDLIEIPGEAVPSLYYAAKPLASGDVGEAAKRFFQPFVDVAKDPVGSFKEHPLGTALIASGAYGALGRGAGFLARHAPSEGLRTFASQDRGVTRLPDTQLEVRRTFSPNLISKRVQLRHDLARSEKARQLYVKANEAETEAVKLQQKGGDAKGKFEEAQHYREQAYKTDPNVITDASKVTLAGKTELQRVADEQTANVEGLRRQERDQIIREGMKALGKKPGNLVNPVAQGIFAADRMAVERYLTQIKEEAKGINPETHRSKLLANEQLQKQLKTALDHPKMDMREVLATANRYNEIANRLDQELQQRGLVDPARGEKAKLISYAVQEMGAKYDTARGRVLGPDGNTIPDPVIRAHMDAQRAAGVPFVDKPSYISQQPYLRSAGAYFMRHIPRVGVQTGARTGEAVRQGLIDAHPSRMVDQLARTQSLITADKAFESVVGEVAYRANGGKVWTAGTKRAANEMKQQLESHGSPVQWRAIRLNPLGANPEALTKFLDATASDAELGIPETAHLHQTLQDAFEGKSPDGGSWGLVPDQWAARNADHQKLLGANQGVRVIQAITSLFRRVVLFRPSFVEGNTIEATLRGALHGALPGMPDYWMLRRARATLSPAARKEFDATVLRTGQYGAAMRHHIHRSADQLGDGRVANTVKALSHFAPVRETVHLWKVVNHVFFNEINARIERQFRMAVAGKDLRKLTFDRKLVALSNKAVAEVAKGMTDTPTMRELGRSLDRAYGQYDAFTPQQRQWLMLYTPFGAWMLNSLRFVLSVLPKDHPIFTSLVVAASQTSQDWRDAQKLTQLGPNANRVPGFLQGSIPGEGGSHLRGFTRFTPFGFWSDPLSTMAQGVLPQFHGITNAFAGTDWKGKPLEDTSILGRLGEAAKEFGGAIVPGMGQGEQLFTGEGDFLQRLRKFADPFMYTPSGHTQTSGGTVLPDRVQKMLDQTAKDVPSSSLPPDVQKMLDDALAGR